MSNVVDLSLQLSLNKTAARVIHRAASVGAVRDDLLAVIAGLEHNEQRFLAAIIAWRIEGGMALPATDLLSHLPSLHGLEFGSIQATAAQLVDAGVLELVEVEKDDKGNATRVAFIWPALERLLELGAERAGGPKIMDLAGNPLR